MDDIKSKLYHVFENEVERLGQEEAARILRVSQPRVSFAMNHPESVSTGWYVGCLKSLGYKCRFSIEKF